MTIKNFDFINSFLGQPLSFQQVCNHSNGTFWIVLLENENTSAGLSSERLWVRDQSQDLEPFTSVWNLQFVLHIVYKLVQVICLWPCFCRNIILNIFLFQFSLIHLRTGTSFFVVMSSTCYIFLFPSVGLEWVATECFFTVDISSSFNALYRDSFVVFKWISLSYVIISSDSESLVSNWSVFIRFGIFQRTCCTKRLTRMIFCANLLPWLTWFPVGWLKLHVKALLSITISFFLSKVYFMLTLTSHKITRKDKHKYEFSLLLISFPDIRAQLHSHWAACPACNFFLFSLCNYILILAEMEYNLI